MRAKAMPGEDPKTLPSPDEVAPRIVDLVSAAYDKTGMRVDILQGEEPL